MNDMWARLVRWLAREHIAYLEYENKELRFEMQRWHDRYEGAMDAVRVFERQHAWLQNTVAEAAFLKPPPTLVIKSAERKV